MTSGQSKHWSRGERLALLGVLVTIGLALLPYLLSRDDSEESRGASSAVASSSPPTSTALPEPTQVATTTDRTSTPLAATTVSYLADLSPIAGGWGYSGPLPINGEHYAHAVTNPCSGSQPYEYDLGRKYDSFETVVGMTDFTGKTGVAQVEFWIDGALAHKSSGIKRGKADTVKFSVHGVLTLKIVSVEIQSTGCGDRVGVALGDPQLIS